MEPAPSESPYRPTSTQQDDELSSENEIICVSPTAPLSPVWSYLTAKRKKNTTTDQPIKGESSTEDELPPPIPSPGPNDEQSRGSSPSNTSPVTPESPIWSPSLVKGNEGAKEEITAPRDGIRIVEKKLAPNLPKLKMIHRKPVLKKGGKCQPIMRITSRGAIIPSSQQSSESEKEEGNEDSRNLKTKYRRNVTPPGERDMRGTITGGDGSTSQMRGGSISPEPSTSEKDISSGRKEVRQEYPCQFCSRNPEYRKGDSRQYGSSSGSEGTTSTDDSEPRVSVNGSTSSRDKGSRRSSTSITTKSKSQRRRKRKNKMQPVINIYVHFNKESTVEWK